MIIFIIDIALIILSEYLAFITRFGYPIPQDELIHFYDLWFIVTLIRIWSLYSHNLFVKKVKSFTSISMNILNANILSTILIVAATFFNRNFSYPRLVILFSFIYSTIFLIFSHYLYWRNFINNNKRKVLIIGATETGKNIIKNSVIFNQYRWDIVGFIDDKQKIGKKIYNNVKIVGRVRDLKKVVDKLGVNLIVIAIPNEKGEYKLKVLSQVEMLGVEYIIIPNFYEIVTGKANIDDIEDFPVLVTQKEGITFANRILKRIFDIIFSLIFLILTFPLFLVIAILIKLTSKGPVFYKQLRAGRNGKPFYIYKFRTMVKDADKMGPLITDKKDRRITPIGKFLRRFSIDEFPQFINVLKGDMSIVGPRPEVVEIVKKYKAWQRKVLSVKPGITGLAQISGRQELDIPTKLKIDLYYINNYSFLLDMEIIFKTIIYIFKGEGAY